MDRLSLEEPSMLGLLNVCGIQTEDAPGVLNAYFAAKSDCYVRAANRVILYQGLVGHLQTCEIQSESGGMQLLQPLRRVECDAFETLAWDVKAAIFLIAALDFGLRDTAQILQTSPAQLMAKLEAALRKLTAPRRSYQRSRGR